MSITINFIYISASNNEKIVDYIRENCSIILKIFEEYFLIYFLSEVLFFSFPLTSTFISYFFLIKIENNFFLSKYIKYNDI